MRKVFLFGIVLLVAAVAVAATLRSRALSLGQEVAATLTAVEGARVSVGSVEADWFSPVARLDSVEVGSELSARSLEIAVPLGALLAGDVSAATLHATGVSLEVRDPRESGLGRTLRALAAGSGGRLAELSFSNLTAQIGGAASTDLKGRFELDGDGYAIEGTGRVFGGEAELQMKVGWNAGSDGGHSVTLGWKLVGADTVAVAAAFPEGTVHPSFKGPLDGEGAAEGFWGGRTTEEVPAEPLRGTARFDLTWEILGRSEPLALSGKWSLDDRRLQWQRGNASWGGVDFRATAWIGLDEDPSMAARFGFDEVDGAAFAEAFGVAPQWQPQTLPSGEFEITGKPSHFFIRYKAKAESLRIAGARGLSLEVEAPRYTGVLRDPGFLAGVSIDAEKVRIGGFETPPVVFGANWDEDRQRLRVAGRGMKLWGGEVDVVVSFVHEEDEYLAAALTGVQVDAAETLAAWIPEQKIAIDGGMDFVMRYGESAGGVTYDGRFALRSATLDDENLIGYASEYLSNEKPFSKLMFEVLPEAYPKTFGLDGTRFVELTGAFRADDDGFELGSLIADMGEARFRGAGRMNKERRLDVTGGLELSRKATERLLREAPQYRALVGLDDRLAIPVLVRGPLDGVTAIVPSWYLRSMAAAAAGEEVDPFVTPLREPLELTSGPLPGVGDF